MNQALKIYEELNLDITTNYNDTKNKLKRLEQEAVGRHYLLGSKRSHYVFENDSSVVWHSGSNWFEVRS